MSRGTQAVLHVPVRQIRNNWKLVQPRRHSLQDMFSRICSFPTSIPSYFIRNYSKEGDVVFDMWSGKGSVPFEALRNNRIGIGNDKSPEAYVMTHAKVRPIAFDELQEFLQYLKDEMSTTGIQNDLTELDKNASIYYSKSTFEQILKLKDILYSDNSRSAIFTKAIILGLLHGNSSVSFSLRCSHSYSMSPKYVKKYAKEHHLRRPRRDLIDCITRKSYLLYRDPLPTIEGQAYNDDSTSLSLPSGYVDLILTSPPYLDRQTYAWGNWLRLWFLGHDYRDIRRTLAESGSINKYQNFMKRSIGELFRVLKHGGRCFIVVGDVRMGRTQKVLNTAEFLIPLCREAGFEVQRVVSDRIPSGRRVMTYIRSNQGIRKERIIYLRKPS